MGQAHGAKLLVTPLVRTEACTICLSLVLLCLKPWSRTVWWVMVSIRACPCLVLLAVQERRSEEGCKAFGQPVCFWIMISQMIVSPGASTGSPSQGHWPPLRRWLCHEIPVALEFSFCPLWMPHLMPQVRAEGLEVPLWPG